MSDAAESIPTKRRIRSMDTRPDAMIELPSDNQELIRVAKGVIEQCRADAGTRAAFYRQINSLVETGKNDGSRSLINLLYNVLDRLASHLFSPAEIRFSMDFENEYDELTLRRGQIAARLLARSWERTNTDVLFAQGVFESLKYGSTFLKQWVKQEGPEKTPSYHASLVMPWQFGVYRPDNNSLDAQPAMCETVMLTMPEVWRRIWHMPDAKQLFDRIKAHAAPGNNSEVANSFFHQVLSTSQIQTGAGQASRPVPGGIVQLSTDPNFGGSGPHSDVPMVMMHELWMWDGDDYATIQIVEPDILLTRFKRGNLLIPGGVNSGLHPYTLIQPNQTHGNIWGRSEIMDLIEPQDLLSTTAADIRRLFGVQVDKILAFSGQDDITDERYDQMRQGGFVNLGTGGNVTDITPSFPAQALPLLDKLIQIIEMISGFDNLLSGRGEPGVRSGEQANPMLQVAGSRLKDRSLVVERQCASAADLRLSIMEAKDGRNYWTDANKQHETSFLLSDLPEDRRVVVDGHTTSPIFANDHQALLMTGLKLGLVDPESAIEQLPFQNKDVLISRLKLKEEKQAKFMAELQHKDPEGFLHLIEKAGHKK